MPPVAAPGAEHLHVRILKVQKREISREQAAALVKRRYGGKILAVSETSRKGRPAYRVKGLSDKSQVYVVYVDKQSGRIMR
nr:PepSY domain-containing protein [Microbulbifer sediminum]